eukprot:scaffold77787_cov31-Phaeocystis_antarctica.AAC.1
MLMVRGRTQAVSTQQLLRSPIYPESMNDGGARAAGENKSRLLVTSTGTLHSALYRSLLELYGVEGRERNFTPQLRGKGDAEGSGVVGGARVNDWRLGVGGRVLDVGWAPEREGHNHALEAGARRRAGGEAGAHGFGRLPRRMAPLMSSMGVTAPRNRDSLKTRMDRAEDARLPHTERQSRLPRPSSALAVGVRALRSACWRAWCSGAGRDRRPRRPHQLGCRLWCHTSHALGTPPMEGRRVIPTTMACPTHLLCCESWKKGALLRGSMSITYRRAALN